MAKNDQEKIEQQQNCVSSLLLDISMEFHFFISRISIKAFSQTCVCHTVTTEILAD